MHCRIWRSSNRDQNNQGGLVAVQLQGDALRKKIEGIYTQYQAETKIVTEISEKQGLDVSSQQESLKEFDAYVKDINAVPQEQVTVPIYTSAQLSFLSVSGHGNVRRFDCMLRVFFYHVRVSLPWYAGETGDRVSR